MSHGSGINSSDADMGIVDNTDIKSCSEAVDTIKDGNVHRLAKSRNAVKLALLVIVGNATTLGGTREGKGVVVGVASAGVA